MPQHIVTAQREASFALPRAGQYTLHLRPSGSPVADRRTVIADQHVVLDNADEGVERSGAWTRSSERVAAMYGRDYELAEPGSEARFTWTLAPPRAGRFVVQACWSAGENRTNAAAYRFGPTGGPMQSAAVDQTVGGGVWWDIGTVELDAGQPCRVELGAAADGIVVADAVRLVMRQG
jgi:hypothetical protein